MNRLFGLIWVICVWMPFWELFSQSALTRRVSGQVVDSALLTPLEGVTVVAFGKQVGVTTVSGTFDVWVPMDVRSLAFRKVGFSECEVALDKTLQAPLRVVLSQRMVHFREMVVDAQANSRLWESFQSGHVELTAKTLATLPKFLGESDFYQAIKLMPGIQSTGDGNASVFVRGGNSDQNMILLDEAVVYNPTHLLGLFSVFNSEVIQNVSVLKAGIPAEFGNRLSSVIKFNTLQRIPDSVTLNGSIGVLSSNVKVLSPIYQDKLGGYLAVRKTYLNTLLSVGRELSLMSTHSSLYNSRYGFYDINAGLVFNSSGNDRVALTLYHGADRFSTLARAVQLNLGMDWGNTIGSLSWGHLFSDSLYLHQYITTSGYTMDMDMAQDVNSLKLSSSIADVGYKNKLTFLLKKHKIQVGLYSVFHSLLPNYSQALSGGQQLQLHKAERLRSNETGVYGSDEFDILPGWLVAIGLRGNYFTQAGPYTSYQTNADEEVVDTLVYSKGDRVCGYFMPDIRFSSRVMLSDIESVKFSYSTNSQFIHMVNVSSVSFPTDFWVSSTKTIKPQRGWNLSVGYFRYWGALGVETSVETYYKALFNQLEFKQGLFSIAENTSIDNSLLSGFGRAYGIEFLIKRQQGVFSGWVSYTLSKTERKFGGIENGAWFNARYDRPHNFSVVASYKLTSRWTVSSVFEFATGSAYTPIVGRYLVANNLVNEYGRYNSARLPSYHRLDISATRQLKTKGRWNSQLNISVFNVYNRANTFFVYPEVTGSLEHYTFKVKAKEIAIFPIMPSVSWIFSY